MNTGPLRSYLEARSAFDRGDKQIAANLLAASMGAEIPTNFMLENLEPLLKANEVSLILILKESKNDG